MLEHASLTHAHLKTPKAAAIAGIAFSLLMFTIFWLLRRSVPADPLESGAWLATDARTVALALNLIPFAGVAFLWFIGVLRDRLGQQEDRFFATVFFGSALLFLAMLFVAAAVIGAVILVAASAEPNELINSATFRFARAATYIVMNVYAIKISAFEAKEVHPSQPSCQFNNRETDRSRAISNRQIGHSIRRHSA